MVGGYFEGFYVLGYNTVHSVEVNRRCREILPPPSLLKNKQKQETSIKQAASYVG
jgi:hypothetical protein